MEFLADETKSVRYGANLEYFVEKLYHNGLTIRLNANNLLGSRKTDHSISYNALAELQSGEPEESIFEIERTKAVFLLTLRGSF